MRTVVAAGRTAALPDREARLPHAPRRLSGGTGLGVVRHRAGGEGRSRVGREVLKGVGRTPAIAINDREPRRGVGEGDDIAPDDRLGERQGDESGIGGVDSDGGDGARRATDPHREALDGREGHVVQRLVVRERERLALDGGALEHRTLPLGLAQANRDRLADGRLREAGKTSPEEGMGIEPVAVGHITVTQSRDETQVIRNVANLKRPAVGKGAGITGEGERKKARARTVCGEEGIDRVRTAIDGEGRAGQTGRVISTGLEAPGPARGGWENGGPNGEASAPERA